MKYLAEPVRKEMLALVLRNFYVLGVVFGPRIIQWSDLYLAQIVRLRHGFHAELIAYHWPFAKLQSAFSCFEGYGVSLDKGDQYIVFRRQHRRPYAGLFRCI